MDLPNIILIVLDTMRKDVLSIYGGPVTVSSLEWLSKDGVVFPNPVAPAPWSMPSHASIFTGKYPSEHGVHETYEMKESRIRSLMRRVPYKTLPERLREIGYNTIGISANDWIAPGTGFERGFDVLMYIHPFSVAKSIFDEINRVLKPLKSKGILPRNISDPFQAAMQLIKVGWYKEVIKLARLYLKAYFIVRSIGYPEIKGGNDIINFIENSSFHEPFFLFVNFMEMHQPYRIDVSRLRLTTYDPLIYLSLFGYKRISDRSIRKIRRNYYNEANIVNKYIWRIIAYLKQRGLYDNTLIIVTGDHGQGLKEHGYYGHGIYLYNEIIEVPLVVKFPGNKRIKVRNGYQSLARLYDLVLNVVEGNYDDVITTDVAFSESFGIAHDLKIVLGKYMNRPDFEEKRRVIDCVRKAVYKDGYKLVYNLTLDRIEEFSYNGKELNVNDNKNIANELLNLVNDNMR